MDAGLLREIIIEHHEAIKNKDLGIPREKLGLIGKFVALPHIIVICGIRRVGKSTLLAQIIDKFYKHEIYYLNFEDERLMDFSSSDFNTLYQIFVELFGERRVFFFDEIQNIKGWEVFVRRMHDQQFKFFITGSNASLFSKELGTKLTGRFLSIELYPFSFKEFLNFKGYFITNKSLMLTRERGKIKRFFNEYFSEGGMPEYLKYKEKDILKRMYEDVLYRDIAARYRIKEIKALREMALYIFSNTSNLFSYNKLKQFLKLGSVNTVKNFAEYLENSFMIFVVNIFSYSLKQQYIAPKKIYGIDNGLINAIAFKLSENRGRLLENLVFLELKRRGAQIYYYKSNRDKEVDFLLKKGLKVSEAIQISQNLAIKETRERELNALTAALKEFNLKEGKILTEDEEENFKIEGKRIKIMPIYKWLLENQI
jgi:predicted AAA+ superfamily ATPase